MKRGLPDGNLRVVTKELTKEAPIIMLHIGLDLSRKRLDFDLLCEDGSRLENGAVPPDADGLRGLARRGGGFYEPGGGAVQSMDGARFLLDRLEVPQAWRGTLDASLALIEDLDDQVRSCERELRALGADHEYVPLLMSAPGIAWVLGYTIAAEIGDINRFDSPSRLCGYTGLCPRVHQSGERDHPGSLAKNGPKYLRWALIEAAVHAACSPVYRDRYQRTATRLGRQRGKKVARVDIARKLAEAIWYMLTRNQPFAPAGATTPLAA